MKILQVNKLYPPVTGGIEQHVKQLAEGWTAHGESRVLVVRDGVGFGDEKIENGVTVRRAGSMGRFRSMPISLTFWYWLWRESARADVVHLHFPFPLAAFSWWLVRPRKPLIVTWHSAVVRQRILGRLVQPFVRYTLRCAEKIIVTFPQAPEVFEELREWRDKCRTIPLGIDSAWWSTPPLPAAARPSEPLFVYAGRLVYYKGLPVLIDAMAQLRTGVLWIVGAGPLRRSLERLAREKKCAERVLFKEAPTDGSFRAYLHAADAVVLASTHSSEVFGLVQLEAMAMGKPLINTALPTGVPWVARDGEEAITVPPGDSAALARAMERLADDASLRECLGAAGKRRVEELFTLDRMRTACYALYKTLL